MNKQVTVSITAPPDNPNPSDVTFDTNFSFLSDSVISAQASLIPSGDASKIDWSVTGAVKNETPADKKGASFSFTPNPPAHRQYVKGDNGCQTGVVGNGSCARSSPLSYGITAAYCAKDNTHTITQDQIDIIIQEYKNHGLPLPSRTEFVAPQTAGPYSSNGTAYSVVRGQPAQMAETILSFYNILLYDDAQTVNTGSNNLAPTTVIVSPGADVPLVGAVLATPPCWPAAVNTCDDQIVGNTIVAGPDGIAQTTARNQQANAGLRLASAWRNPERNEAVGGVWNSNHQNGNAIDLVPSTNVGGANGDLTKPQLYCILDAAIIAAGYTSIPEMPLSNATQPCNNSNNNHIHAE